MIKEGKYKDIDAVILETLELKVTVVPLAGARTASILYLLSGEEMLWQNPAPIHAPVKYAQGYPAGEFAGFDEMFPTITECPYPDYPWEGSHIPDHGEVWALPWQYKIEDESVRLWVNGIRLPYRLEKTISLSGSNIKTVYHLENLSPFPMPCIYAAHPLFNICPGAKLILPGNLKTIVNAVPSENLPDYGSEYSYPVFYLANGAAVDLSLMPEKNSKGYKKYYFKEKNDEGWSIIYRPDLLLNIGMSFSPSILPYFGIWMNEGGWDNQYNLAPEPSSAAMDSITAAREWKTESILKPYESIEWKLDFCFAEGEPGTGMDKAGLIF